MAEEERKNRTAGGVDSQDQPRELVSAFVITFNEEDQIRACLESLAFCDEVVVIDSFSTDRTVEICEAFGARVIQREWPGYRDQKAFGLASCTHEWVVNLDADERVSKELRESIVGVLREDYACEHGSAVKSTDQINGYSISRVVYHLGRWWRRGGWYPEYRVRFFRKSKVSWGGVDPHEKPIVEGKVARLGGEIYHFTYKDLGEQLERLQTFSSIAAEEEYKMGRRASLRHLLFNPFLRAFKFYILKKGYREGVAGLVVSIIEGYYTFLKYAKLWERGLNNKDSKVDEYG